MITVLIPTLNRANSLRAALQSVMDQTHKPERVIVVDNASEDNTQNVIREFSGNASGVEVVNIRHRERLPMFDNWLSGVEAVSSKWLKILPDDDTLAGACLEELAALSDGATVVQCAAVMDGTVSYAACVNSVVELPAAIEQGRMSANPVTALIRTDAALSAWGMFDLLSDATRASAFGPNLLLMYGAVLNDWSAHRHTPKPLVNIGGFTGAGDEKSYTLRVMHNDFNLWQNAYAETYTLMAKLIGSS
jgi:glycosyltransferase involved in cell wall biosynthesis